MALYDFLTGAVREFAFQNYAVAMACVCTALDATAKAEYGGGTRQRCLKYVDRYLDIITLVGFGGAIVAVPGSTLKINDPINRNKTTNITEIIYDSIRCSLIHEANLPFAVAFTEINLWNGKLRLPHPNTLHHSFIVSCCSFSPQLGCKNGRILGHCAR